jgi:large subunit ribosomal protein L10
MAHVAEWKKEEVKELIEIINKYDVIGIVDLMNIPAKQLQEMRKNLKKDAVIRMSKKNLIDLAFEDCNADKTNIVDLSEHMDGQVALIATEMNPFKLYKILEKSKTSAPAKAGTIAPDDIVVPEGDTGITNLAFMGELGQVGIQARPMDGKIFIPKETVVVAAGEEVSKQMAATLTRLDINPMEVGIDLKAVYEEGSIYTSDLLAIDEEQTLADIQGAFASAFNLSVNAAIPTEETTSTLITLAYTRAVNVGVAGAIMTAETSEPIIGLAQAKMMAIASEVSGVEGALSEALAEKVSNIAVEADVDDNNNDPDPGNEPGSGSGDDEEKDEQPPELGLGLLF